jgi:hypothetical protein
MSTPGQDQHREDPEGSFAAASEREAEFQELLREHDGDWQAATDAQQRGERPRREGGGSAMP